MRVGFRSKLGAAGGKFLCDCRPTGKKTGLIRTRMTPRAEDAARLDHIQAEFFSAGEDLGRFRAWVEPDFADGFSLHLIEDSQADGRGHVKADLVEGGQGDGVQIAIGWQALDVFEYRVNRKHGPAGVAECAYGFVAEFGTVSAWRRRRQRFLARACSCWLRTVGWVVLRFVSGANGIGQGARGR